MTLAKAKAKTNETFIAQASLLIVTYNHKNMFIGQATVLSHLLSSLEGRNGGALTLHQLAIFVNWQN